MCIRDRGALPFSQRAAELLDDRSATALPVEEVLGTHVRALVVLGDIDEARLVAARARVLLEARARHLPPEAQERFWAAKARRAFLESEALAAQ